MLTNCQTNALTSLRAFLADDGSDCFILRGSAGTGKTTLLGQVLQELKAAERPIKMMAPTGRAARIMSERARLEANTIHRTIYNFKDLREYRTTDEEGEETFRFFFTLQQSETRQRPVYVVDEASMLGNRYHEQEFYRFGSGRLLKDLIEYIGFGGLRNAKLVLVGDAAQLPPVGENFSPALDAEYLRNEFNLKVQEAELREVVRQRESSYILKNAVTLRNSIEQKSFNKLALSTEADTCAIELGSLMPAYLEACKGQISDSAIILCYGNKTAQRYNKMVREHFYPGHAEIQPGDRVIITKNRYRNDVVLLNGQFAEIASVVSEPEERSIPIGKGKNPVRLRFQDIVLRTESDGKQVEVRSKFFCNLLYSDEPTPGPDEVRALYIDFKIRSGLREGMEEFKQAIKHDPYFNALFMKFGYAITGHKSQGGEWPVTFVDTDSVKQKRSAEYFRWTYTAITRAQEKLYLLNYTPFSALDGLLLPKPITLSPEPVQPIGVRIEGQILEEARYLLTRFFRAEEPEFLKNKFIELYALLRPARISVSGRIGAQNLERYTFSFGTGQAALNFYYKGDNIFSRTLNDQTRTNDPKLLDQVLQLIDKKVCWPEEEKAAIETTEVPDLLYPNDMPFLKEFGLLLVECMQGNGIMVKSVEHLEWYERYTFTRGTEKAVIDFGYDGRGRWGHTKKVTKGTTSEVIAADVFKSVQDLKQAAV